MREKPWKSRALAAAGRMLDAVIKGAFSPLGRRRQAIAVATIYEQLSFFYRADIEPGRSLLFYAPGYKPAARGISLFSKQPEVPGWIATFRPGDVFWDIGANVGAYSLFAAARPGVQVIAFEPEASNYFVLTRNIAANGLFDRILPYCLALSDGFAFSTLSSFHQAIGGSKHAFGDTAESWEADDRPVMRQGMVAFTVDALIATHGFPAPNHMKIDVDGIEEKILVGASNTLADPRLKSIHVEVQKHKPAAEAAIRQILTDRGFRLEVESGPNLIWARGTTSLKTS